MSRHAVEWAATACDDLEAIVAFIADDRLANALAVLARLEARTATLVTFPLRGRIVPELHWHGVMAFRELTEKPWRVIYRIEAQRVLVVSVLDGRRSLEDLLLHRFLR